MSEPAPQNSQPDIIRLPRTLSLVADVVAKYLKSGAKSASERSLEERKKLLDHFAADFGHEHIADCHGGRLLDWLDSHPSWKARSTRKRINATIQAVFNWAQRLGWIARNPFKGVQLESGEHGRSMTKDEFRLLRRNTDEPFRHVLWFGRLTGCRPGEMAALEWSMMNLDLPNGFGMATLKDHKTARKTGKPRTIILVPWLVRLIRCLQRRDPHPRFVFTNSQGNPWNRFALAGRIKRARKRLKLPLSCKLYGLRHKFITDALKNGTPIKLVSELAGHSSVKTTEIYAHLEAMDLLGAAIQAVHPLKHD